MKVFFFRIEIGIPSSRVITRFYQGGGFIYSIVISLNNFNLPMNENVGNIDKHRKRKHESHSVSMISLRILDNKHFSSKDF